MSDVGYVDINNNKVIIKLFKVTSVPFIKVASDFKSMYITEASNVLVMAI